MNLLLGDQSIPILYGTLGTGFVLTGTLGVGPVLLGSTDDKIVHDLILVDGNVPVSGGLDQRIDCVLRTFLGEWWLDPGQGIPYFQELFKKTPDLAVARQAFLTVIKSVPGVVEVTSLIVGFTNATGTFRVDFTVRGTDSTVSGISEVVA